MAEDRENRQESALPRPRSDAATLRAFVGIARLGTVARAAEALGRTQPSISARLASLEEAWGTRLFRREARGMALTPEGARLLPGAEAALRALEDLDRAAGLPVTGSGQLRVGAGDALGRELLPGALRKLLKEDPGLAVRILEGPGSALLDSLRGGEIDLALVVEPPAGLRSDGLDLASFLDSPVDLLLPPGRSVPRGRSITAEILGREPVVALQPGSTFRRHLEDALARAGIPFRPSVEVGNFSLVHRFVAAGLGVAPVPAIAIATRAPGRPVERRRLRGVPPVRYLRASRAGVPIPPPVHRLLHWCRELQGSRS
jgi:DNA-binding transcriptional LysR family regulator